MSFTQRRQAAEIAVVSYLKSRTWATPSQIRRALGVTTNSLRRVLEQSRLNNLICVVERDGEVVLAGCLQDATLTPLHLAFRVGEGRNAGRLEVTDAELEILEDWADRRHASATLGSARREKEPGPSTLSLQSVLMRWRGGHAAGLAPSP